MKKARLAAAAALLSLCLGATAADDRAPQEKDMGAYLMVYHKDADHGLHMALSYDGYKFKALNGDKPVIAGDTIAEQKGIRDPHIFRGPDGAFYLSMTDLHVFARQKGLRDTEWQRDGKQFGWGNNRALVLMKSRDLINWSRANIRIDQLSPQLADIGCAWAPATAYDYDKQKLMVFFTMRHRTQKCKLYYCYVNDDYNRMETLPEVLFEYPKKDCEAIDGDITYADGTYHLFYCSHDGTAGVKQATSRSITGPWQYDSAYCDFERVGCEAPHVYKLIGQRKWILMYDIYRINPHNFGFAETADLKEFKNLGHFDRGAMRREGFSEQKHGAVVWLTKEEAKRLEERWP